jgi:hypothetical protein
MSDSRLLHLQRLDLPAILPSTTAFRHDWSFKLLSLILDQLHAVPDGNYILSHEQHSTHVGILHAIGTQMRNTSTKPATASTSQPTSSPPPPLLPATSSSSSSTDNDGTHEDDEDTEADRLMICDDEDQDARATPTPPTTHAEPLPNSTSPSPSPSSPPPSPSPTTCATSTSTPILLHHTQHSEVIDILAQHLQAGQTNATASLVIMPTWPSSKLPNRIPHTFPPPAQLLNPDPSHATVHHHSTRRSAAKKRKRSNSGTRNGGTSKSRAHKRHHHDVQPQHNRNASTNHSSVTVVARDLQHIVRDVL